MYYIYSSEMSLFDIALSVCVWKLANFIVPSFIVGVSSNHAYGNENKRK